jgi:hypothetical protein
MMPESKPDPAIADLLNVPISALKMSSGGGRGSSSATNFKLVAISDHSEAHYFVKCAKGAAGKVMIEGISQ